MLITAIVLILLVVSVSLFLHQPSFGAPASGERKKRMEASPHFRENKFHNLSPTPDLAEGVGYYRVMKDFFFAKSAANKPHHPISSVKTNLASLDPGLDLLVWMGHSSYYLQLDGKKFLVDPVLSGHASPVTFTTPSFPGTDAFRVEDLPPIDYLLITHDHWDHLDYQTVRALQPGVKKIITGLGTGGHMERWGYLSSQIVELDWYETTRLEPSFILQAMPARHFSGRGLKRNGNLWVSFILQSSKRKLFIGGDSGFDTHFANIGASHGPFDLAILECGQYNAYWKYIHMMPEEVVQAALDLGAKTLLPVHWGKFALALHDWNEPIKRVVAEAKKKSLPVLYPMIGEVERLDDIERGGEEWWT